jgi:effector-binding domain-containing protein
MVDMPEIVTTTDCAYASLHLRVPRAEIGAVMGPGLREVHGALQSLGVAGIGPWFTHHFARPATDFDVEICVPVAEAIPAVGRVKPGLWPAMRVVRTVYQGDYSGLPGAWGELLAWIEGQGFETAEDLWERYRVGPESGSNAERWQTELNRPLLD